MSLDLELRNVKRHHANESLAYDLEDFTCISTCILYFVPRYPRFRFCLIYINTSGFKPYDKKSKTLWNAPSGLYSETAYGDFVLQHRWKYPDYVVEIENRVRYMYSEWFPNGENMLTFPIVNFRTIPVSFSERKMIICVNKDIFVISLSSIFIVLLINCTRICVFLFN